MTGDGARFAVIPIKIPLVGSQSPPITNPGGCNRGVPTKGESTAHGQNEDSITRARTHP